VALECGHRQHRPPWAERARVLKKRGETDEWARRSDAGTPTSRPPDQRHPLGDGASRRRQAFLDPEVDRSAQVRVDLTRATFVDSTALGVVVAACK
jgi:hypothetical protein